LYTKILVTGGSGFIGSNFIRYMLNKYPSVEIINLDSLTYCGNPENLSDISATPQYKFVQGDICDKKLCRELMEKVDAVVNFAAESHVDNSIKNSYQFVKTNVMGTQNLLDAALDSSLKLFYHISTDEVFGDLSSTDPAFNEDTPYNPRSPYSASKAASDHLVRAYHHTHKLPIIISNCSNNYGPYQYPEKMIPLFITNILEGKKVPVYGNGENVRDWLHVVDHCNAIDVILNRGRVGETYCIGGGCEMKNIDITKLILKEMGASENMIEYVEDRKGHDHRYAIDFSKLKKETGWQPEHNFLDGLQETIFWYKKNELWWKKIKK